MGLQVGITLQQRPFLEFNCWPSLFSYLWDALVLRRVLIAYGLHMRLFQAKNILGGWQLVAKWQLTIIYTLILRRCSSHLPICPPIHHNPTTTRADIHINYILFKYIFFYSHHDFLSFLWVSPRNSVNRPLNAIRPSWILHILSHRHTHAINDLRTHSPHTNYLSPTRRAAQPYSHRRCDGISRYQRVKQLTTSFYRLIINTSNIFGIIRLWVCFNNFFFLKLCLYSYINCDVCK